MRQCFLLCIICTSVIIKIVYIFRRAIGHLSDVHSCPIFPLLRVGKGVPRTDSWALCIKHILSKNLSWFLVWLYVLLLSFTNSWFMLTVNYLSSIWFENFFSHSRDVSSVFSWLLRNFELNETPFICLLLLPVLWEMYLSDHFSDQYQLALSVFSSICFIILVLYPNIWSIELIFIHEITLCMRFYFLTVCRELPQQHFVKRIIFSPGVFLAVLSKIDGIVFFCAL